MTVRQYLSQIERYDNLIKNRQTEISQLWDLATNITVPTDSERVQTSGNKDRIGEIVSKITDLETERNQYINIYVGTKEKAIRSMEKVSDTRHYRILFKRYIEYKTLSEISSELSYSYRQVKRLHGEALREIEKIINF